MIELFYSVKVSEVLLRIVSEWQEVGTDFENMWAQHDILKDQIISLFIAEYSKFGNF